MKPITNEYVTVSELKKSPAKVIERAQASGQPVPILRNNQIEGHFVPANAMQLISASDEEVQDALAAVLEKYGDAITWLAKN